MGRVVRAHGLRGELVVLSHSEDPELLREATELTLEGRPGAIPHRVCSVRPLKQRQDGRWLLRVALAGIDQRERAESWVSAAVLVPAAALEAARGDDLYWRDLIGLVCRVEGGEPIGRVREIWASPAHDVLVVEGPAGQWLLPAVDAVLRSVDAAAGEIQVQIPEGVFPQPPSPGKPSGT